MNKKISLFLSIFLIFSLFTGVIPKAKAIVSPTFHIHINCTGGYISSVNGSSAVTDIDIPTGGFFMVNFSPNLGNDLTLLNDNSIEKTSSVYKNYAGGYFQNYTYTIYSVSEDHTIDITMDVTNYVVNVASNAGGTVSHLGANSISAGTSLFITAVPDTFYKLYKIFDNGVEKPLSGSNYYIVPSVHETHNVLFYFATPPITVLAYTTGDCGQAAPTYTYSEYGSSASVSFYPCAGYELATVTDNGVPVTPANPYVLTNLLTNHTIVGTFKTMSCYVNIGSTGRGSISLSPAAASYKYGTSVKATMTPDDIYSKLSYILVDGVKYDYSGTTGTVDYTITSLAKKITEIKAFFVEIPDITPPTLTLISPESEILNLTKDNFFNVVYTATDDRPLNVSSSIILDGTTVYQSSTNNANTTFKLVVAQGMNEVIVEAHDLAGNKIEKKFKVFCDSVPPLLTVDSLPDLTEEKEIKIKGNVRDDTSGLSSLVINGISVFPNSDGSFTYSVGLKSGENVFEVVATDKVGNISKFTKTIKRGKIPDPLQKGKIVLVNGLSVITVDGVSKDIGVAPIIKNGVTLVPLRFLSEYSGADILWFPSFKQITITFGGKIITLKIGSNISSVNGKELKLDVAPQTIDGHTLVPLRFVAENLGFTVFWNSFNKSITLTKN